MLFGVAQWPPTRLKQKSESIPKPLNSYSSQKSGSHFKCSVRRAWDRVLPNHGQWKDGAMHDTRNYVQEVLLYCWLKTQICSNVVSTWNDNLSTAYGWLYPRETLNEHVRLHPAKRRPAGIHKTHADSRTPSDRLNWPSVLGAALTHTYYCNFPSGFWWPSFRHLLQPAWCLLPHQHSKQVSLLRWSVKFSILFVYFLTI